MKEQEFQEFLKANSEQLIVFGTGIMCGYLCQALEKLEISISAFCDNNQALWGTEKKIGGVQICSLDEIKATYESPIFLISLLFEDHQNSIIAQLEAAGFSTYFTLIHCAEYIKTFEVPHKWDAIGIKRGIMRKYRTVDSPITYKDFVSLEVTQKCNLRCKDCVAGIPYIENPKHMKKEQVFAYVDRLSEVFDKLIHVNLIGGEIFMHPDVYEMIAYAQSKSTFENVVIYTNGTILPKKEELLKLDCSRLCVFISNYGALSQKRTEIMELFDELHIAYMSSDELEWFKKPPYAYRGRTEDELTHLYQTCSDDCSIFKDGKLFQCGPALGVYLNEEIPESESAFLDIMDTSKPIPQLQQEIKDLFYGRKYIKPCNWCYGWTREEEVKIPVAEQL